MKVEKVSLKDFEEELRKASLVVTRRRTRSTLEQAYFDIQQSKEELRKIRDNCGGIDYDYRRGSWYIVFPMLDKEIGVFSSREKAEGWAGKFLGVN